MNIEASHIRNIKTKFDEMQSVSEFLSLLNEAKRLIYGDKAKPFEMRQLYWHAFPNEKQRGNNGYSEFVIRKKSGSVRKIHAPGHGLKVMQQSLNLILQCIFSPHRAAMGFAKGKSIVDNARLHVGSNYVYNIDLKDFFPSIDQARFWKCLQLKPFNLNEASSVEPQFMTFEDFRTEYLKTKNPISFYKGKSKIVSATPYGYIYCAKNFDRQKEKYILFEKSSSEQVKNANSFLLVNEVPKNARLQIANIIAGICCTEISVERTNAEGQWISMKKRVLPQGAPTSPLISNIVCQKLDFLLSGVAKRYNLKYSRYADDITFSSMYNVYQPQSEFLKELHRIISEQNFHIKESKTRLQKDGYRKEVTGLLVNEKANVQQRYIKQLRMWLYYWERYGYERASGFFLQQYVADKGHVKKGKADMTNVISGKLDYLKMVKGGDNELYLKLKGRFETLVNLGNPLNKMLDIWEFEGINEAMEFHYQNNWTMNKYDFIADLLEKEKLDLSQKERVIKLIVNELKTDGINQIEIEERIKQIEHMLSLKISMGKKGENIGDSSTQSDLPDYIDPTQLSKFLSAYNQDPMLKYTCHEIDMDGLITINHNCKTETFTLAKYQEQLPIFLKT